MENKELIAALIAAQKDMDVVTRSAENNHFKNTYAKIEDIIFTSAPVLNKHGLAITQYAYTADAFAGQVPDTYLITKLLHTSGQEICSKILIHLKDPTNMQEFCKAMTYIRRYTYAAMCGIISGEIDDDGNESAKDSPKSNSPQSEPSSQGDCISVKQLGLLKAKLNHQPEIEAVILKNYTIKDLAQLPWRKFNDVLKMLE